MQYCDMAATPLKPPLVEESRRQVFREHGGADFTVTAVNVSVCSTGERMTLHVASVKDGHPGAVCVAVLRHDGVDYYLLAQHWRVATGQWDWEFPRGMGESGETSIDTAIRELHEESGLSAVPKQIRVLQTIHADAGVLYDHIDVAEVVFSADEEVSQALSIIPMNGRQNGSDWELSNLQWVSAGALKTAIGHGTIVDSITLSAFALCEIQKRCGL